jgi:hypothetical protein
MIEPPITLLTTTEKQQPRAIIYINKKQLSTNSYAQISLPFSDAVAVAIQTSDSDNDKPALIVNIYNPHDNNLITLL